MWLRLVIFYNLLTIFVVGHVPEYMSTPANKIDQFCNLADTCVHDTIRICGKNGEKTRTFLDICDLLEYACDTGEVYMHTDDVPGCPPAEKPKKQS